MSQLLMSLVEKAIGVVVCFVSSMTVMIYLQRLGDRRALRNYKYSAKRLIRQRRLMRLPPWILALEIFVLCVLYSYYFF